MVVLNYTGGEINAKIVYYGPGVSGKTTNLEHIHEKTPANAKGKMVSMKTQTDRTLFFDFLPLELGEINGYRTRFLLYTVPGQVYYNATRKLVLKGVDAIVFVADSSRGKLEENLESLKNLEQNLNEHGMSLDDVPWVIQYNKRDVADAMPVDELNARLNPLKVPAHEGVATQGTGVFETLHDIATMVYRVLQERLADEDNMPATEGHALGEVAPPATPPPTAPAPKPQPVYAGAAPAAQPQVAPAARAEPDDDENELEFAVDFALRESDDEPGSGGGTPPRKMRGVGDLPVARPDNPESDSLFESVPESTFDDSLGRLPELDAAGVASESVRHQANEFVTDPMRQSTREPAQRSASPVTSVRPKQSLPVPRQATTSESPSAAAAAPSKSSPRPSAPQPAPAAGAPAAPAPATPTRAPTAAAPEAPRPIRVPLRLSRQQIASGRTVRIVLDITLDD
jgi:signal recognition particle receptor subunit beta